MNQEQLEKLASSLCWDLCAEWGQWMTPDRDLVDFARAVEAYTLLRYGISGGDEQWRKEKLLEEHKLMCEHEIEVEHIHEYSEGKA